MGLLPAHFGGKLGCKQILGCDILEKVGYSAIKMSLLLPQQSHHQLHNIANNYCCPFFFIYIRICDFFSPDFSDIG